MIVAERRYESLEQARAVHPAWMEIDLDALAHNYREVERRVRPGTRIIASVKANAYGHGIREVARALERLGAHALATGSFTDAVAMREAGVEAPILMFAGNTPAGIPDYLRHRLTPTIYDRATAEAVSAAAAEETAVYVKVESGLGRLGVPVDEAVSFIRDVARLPRLRVEGVYTHLPFVDRAGAEWAEERIGVFAGMLDALAQAGIRVPITQALASSGLAAGLADRSSAVCPGHLLYGGLGRIKDDSGDLGPYRPVLKAIKARLIQVWRAGRARRAGGGGMQELAAGSRVGVVPLGLFDGYRNARGGRTAWMLVRGRRAPVTAVNLEYTVLDLSGIAGAEAGEEVVAVGESGPERIGVEDLAAWQEAGPLEVLMAFDERLPRVYFGG
ncbi:MAG: alanine racemase [Proteobacteria bacterium]|nr:alanine racemase [Pseudomonadota bacterium]